jgi:hypothetical protein
VAKAAHPRATSTNPAGLIAESTTRKTEVLYSRPIHQIKPGPAGPAAARYMLPQTHTTPVERSLLLTAMIILPLENYFPPVAGMTVSFLMFVVLAAYIIVNRPRILGEMWYHPVFIAAYAFIGVSVLLEFTSPLPRYGDLIRFGQMIGGALCVAVLCRDRSALTVGLYGYIATAFWVSVVLFSTGYETLQGMQADDFDEASRVRHQAFGDKPLGANINELSFIVAQGAIVAFALSLSERLKLPRILLLGIGAFCLIASFLPMSRGVAVVTLVSFATILYNQGFRYGKALVIASILGMGVYMVVPDAIWGRMVFSTEVQRHGKLESRAELYTTALDRLPEYIVAGVGAGNYFEKWGLEKGFPRHKGGVTVALGVHNSFLAITIYWGVLGLSLFLWMTWCVYRSIPSRCGRDELSLALLGIIVAIGLYLFQIHGFYDKPVAFAVGMLVGARQWIWPTGIVSEVVGNKRSSVPI